MTADEAKAFEHANIILQALGVQERVEVVLSQVHAAQGGRGPALLRRPARPGHRRGDPGGADRRARSAEGGRGADSEGARSRRPGQHHGRAGPLRRRGAADAAAPEDVVSFVGYDPGSDPVPEPMGLGDDSSLGARDRRGAAAARPARRRTTSRPRPIRTSPRDRRAPAAPAGGATRRASLLALFLLGAGRGGGGRDLRHEVRARSVRSRRRPSHPPLRAADADGTLPTLRDRARGRALGSAAPAAARSRRPPSASAPRRALPKHSSGRRARSRCRRRTAGLQRPSAPAGGSPALGIPSQRPGGCARRLLHALDRAGDLGAGGIAPPAPRPRRRSRPAAVGVRPAAQPLENLIGRTLNHRYLVEDKIGEGGFGAVFRGKQIATGREVALKILHPHNVSRRDHRRPLPPRGRGLLEAARPAHRHDLRLRRDPRRHPLPGDGAAARAEPAPAAEGRGAARRTRACSSILDQVAASLSEAHANGIVHRDMKPENVFIETRDGRRPRQGARLRHRQGDVRRAAGPGADRRRPDAGDARVHVARAAPRAEARRALRPLRARHDVVRDADRDPPLRRRRRARSTSSTST